MRDFSAGTVVYFWAAANDTSGSGADPTSGEAFAVRKGGDAGSGAPTATGTPTLLSHASYPAGLLEIAVDTTGYSAGQYAVFCTALVDSQNPAGFLGSFTVGTPARAATITNADKSGYDLNADQSAVTIGTVTTNTDMRGTDNAALASVCTEGRLAELDAGNLPTDIAALNDISAADVLTQALAALNTAIGVSPTADSVNERLKTMDDAYTAARAAYLDALNGHTAQTGDTYELANGASGFDALAALLGALNDPTAAAIADAILGRNIAGGSEGGRTVTSALRGIRNKSVISGGTLTVYEEDDVTSAWTAAVTTAPGDPVSEVDPA